MQETKTDVVSKEMSLYEGET
jgi:hypothetical protein